MQLTLLAGNLTKDAVVNASGEGEAVSFTVVTNDPYKDKDGNWVENPTFHPCVRFVKAGNGAKLAEMLMKGRHVEIEGQIMTSKPRKGKLRDSDEEKMFVNKSIRVEEIMFGAKPKEKEETPAA